jgi:hypothetical protein
MSGILSQLIQGSSYILQCILVLSLLFNQVHCSGFQDALGQGYAVMPEQDFQKKSVLLKKLDADSSTPENSISGGVLLVAVMCTAIM